MICQPDEVHVWTIPFDEVTDPEAHMLSQLSKDEVERAARFVPEHARRAYVISHYALRDILLRYVDKVEFQVETRGKPRLIDSTLEFSLSHTTGMAAVAVANCAVGIDVEALREIDGVDDLATRFLSEEDACAIRESSTPVLRFLEIWTTYEARAKCSGQGLAGLDKKIPLPPFSKGDSSFVENLTMPSGFVGAIATSRVGLTVKYFNWPDHV